MTTPFSYAVVLPHALKERYPVSGSPSFMAQLPIVAIDTSAQPDPTGVQKGTLISNPRDDSDPYADLRFSYCLCRGSGDMETIGYCLQYENLFSVDLPRAERMLRMLRKIRKANQNLPAQLTNFAQYVTMLAPMVGIKYMVTAEDEETEKRNHYPTGWYRILGIREAQSYIKNLVDAVDDRILNQISAGHVST